MIIFADIFMLLVVKTEDPVSIWLSDMIRSKIDGKERQV